MTGRLGASVIGGLMAGVVFGLLMQMMLAPALDGGRMTVLAMVGQIVGSPTLLAGWVSHLVNSAIIGALFGWLLGGRVHSFASGLGWGAAYGFAWWIVGGLILMPLFLGMPPFAGLTEPGMQLVALGSLVGHLVYGLILGGGFEWLHYGVRRGAPLRA
jgi:hypothetical protein